MKIPLSILVFVVLIFLLFTECGTTTQPKVTTVSNYYQEPHRPQYHFSPEEMWMNDPNGMVYYEGEYHLFYQHYPDSNVWGPMHWGHAVSEDLIHWEHLPIALYPDEKGYIFSGSAVVDWKNTSGFGNDSSPPLVAIYTYHDMQGEKADRVDYQTQAIAYSMDKGRNWQKYEGNPVIGNPGIRDFRDPKVFWHQDSQKWIMILAVQQHAELYGSPDLKNWEKLSDFGDGEGNHNGVWECPDLFPLTVKGTDNEKWVMIISLGPGDGAGPNGGSATQYYIGDFDGEQFTNENPPEEVLWLDYGKDNYAGVTWSDIPEEDGRRIFIGWMSNWEYANIVPTEEWRSAMTIPRRLSLSQTEEGVRLISNPVKELNAIRGEQFKIQSQTLDGVADLTDHIPFEIATAEMVLEYTLNEDTKNFGLEFSNRLGQKLIVGYNARDNEFYVDRTKSGKVNFSEKFPGVHTAPRISTDEKITFRVLLDVSSVELFADEGQIAMTELVFPEEDYTDIEIFSKNGTVELNTGQVVNLSSIWKEQEKLTMLESE